MPIKVSFSGRYKDLTGVDSILVDEPNLQTVEDVVVEIVFEFSALGVDKSRMMVFRDGVNLSYEEQVFDGDELVFSPPLVSGG